MFNWKWRRRHTEPLVVVDDDTAPPYSPRHARDRMSRRRRPGGTRQMPDVTRGGWQ